MWCSRRIQPWTEVARASHSICEGRSHPGMNALLSRPCRPTRRESSRRPRQERRQEQPPPQGAAGRARARRHRADSPEEDGDRRSVLRGPAGRSPGSARRGWPRPSATAASPSWSKASSISRSNSPSSYHRRGDHRPAGARGPLGSDQRASPSPRSPRPPRTTAPIQVGPKMLLPSSKVFDAASATPAEARMTAKELRQARRAPG